MEVLFQLFGLVSVYTIWITPFTFVFGLIAAIKKATKDEEFITEGMVSAISLLLMIMTLIYSVSYRT